MRNLSRYEFKRILIIKPSSFGDVIHALPVLNGLRCRYRRARISWLVSTTCAGLLEGHEALDEVIPFDRRRFGRLGRDVGVTREFIRFVMALRERRFDLVVDLQGLFRSGFLALASGARARLGFANAREMGWIFYSDRVAVAHPDMHAVDRNYLFGRPLGFGDVPARFALPIADHARRTAQALLRKEGVQGARYCVLAPGTRWETKKWTSTGFAEVIRRLRDQFGLEVVLIGMADEQAIAQEVADLAGGPLANLTGRTSLEELKALIDDARLAVMHDSGPMHLAVALGTPLAALYGPTSAQRTGPYARAETVVQLDLACSPCYFRHLHQCPYDHRCMKELTPDHVMETVQRVMSERGRER